jgi:hypothetical protein
MNHLVKRNGYEIKIEAETISGELEGQCYVARM